MRSEKSRSTSLGFTIIELLVVIALVSTLVGFISFNLLGVQQKTNIKSTGEMLISQIRGQQAKAMSGIGAGAPQSYGIHIEPTRFVLFVGTSFDSTDTRNLATNTEGATLSTLFPSDTIVFQVLTGEIVNYSSSTSTVTVQTTDGTKQEILTINKYGALVNLQ